MNVSDALRLCLQFGVFLFFAGWVAIMTVYVWIMLPETKGVPVEEIMDVWARYMSAFSLPSDVDNIIENNAMMPARL